MPDRAYKLISRTGMSQQDLAIAFGVSNAAITQWKDQYPPFLKAINQGYYDFNSGEIVKALATRAKGFTIDEEKLFCSEGSVIRARTKKYYPPDTSAIMYWLNNRRKDEWAYNSKLEVSGKLQTEETGAAAMALAELLKASPIDNIRTFRDSVKQIAEGANGHCQS
jgi:transcriptional regulator with XRE-family HTH domain